MSNFWAGYLLGLWSGLIVTGTAWYIEWSRRT